MGGEALIGQWLIAMIVVAVGGAVSLLRRFGIIRSRDRAVPSAERGTAFWTRQMIKVVIVAFALWQIVIILSEGFK
jgi:hypothetical protein